jgi:hypothetical protein
VDFDGCQFLALGGFQGFVEWWQQGAAARDSNAGVLAFSDEGFKLVVVNVATAQGRFDGLPKAGDLFGWELNGAFQAVKDPAQNFLDRVPKAFPLGD